MIKPDHCPYEFIRHAYIINVRICEESVVNRLSAESLIETHAKRDLK
jgi:hypothetical protein